MKWNDLLKSGIAETYPVADALMARVSDADLAWKPASGSNWMTVGQLLEHMTTACGFCFRGFVTGDWGMPPDMKIEDLPPEAMLPPAEKMPTVNSVSEARKKLASDKEMALAMVKQAGEADLDSKLLSAPWDPTHTKKPLGQHLLNMILHLGAHKSQLFYYLKLMGKPVNTHDLWGG